MILNLIKKIIGICQMHDYEIFSKGKNKYGEFYVIVKCTKCNKYKRITDS